MLSSMVRANRFGAQWLPSVAVSAGLLLATFVAVGLVVTGWFPESSSPALFRQTVLAPNLAVVCLRDGCGCDKRPLTWIEEATKRGTPVLVLIDRTRVTEKEVQDFRKALPVGDVALHHTDSSSLLRRYAPSGRSTLTLTRFGIVDTQSTEVGTTGLSGVKGAIR